MHLPIRDWLNQGLDLLYPITCLICHEDLQYSKLELVCPLCRARLQLSDTHLNASSELQNRLKDFFPFTWIFCKYRYPKQSIVESIIHPFKYKHLPYIGTVEGAHYGKILLPKLKEIGVTHIVPIPIHWLKKLKRGYNQCDFIAQGLHQTTGLPILSHWLYRQKYTQTQTKLSRSKRIKNLKKAFRLHRKNGPTNGNPHILLIDDVLTTGITLSEAAQCIQSALPLAKISVCTLAYRTN